MNTDSPPSRTAGRLPKQAFGASGGEGVDRARYVEEMILEKPADCRPVARLIELLRLGRAAVRAEAPVDSIAEQARPERLDVDRKDATGLNLAERVKCEGAEVIDRVKPVLLLAREGLDNSVGVAESAPTTA